MDRVLDMTNTEIITKYKNGTSISILADLNACKTDVIKEIIGLPKPKPEKKITVKQSHPSVMPKRTTSEMHVLHCEMKKLYVKGGRDVEIARQLNCSPVIVGEWRRKNNLPSNHVIKEEAVPPVVPEPMSQEEKEMFFADICSDTGGQDNEPTIAHLKSGEPEEPFITPEQLDQIKIAVIARSVKNVEPEHKEAPSRGLEPRRYWDLTRKDNIRKAIIGQLQDNCELPVEWIEEWNERVSV